MTLDSRLENDTRRLLELPMATLLLADDRRWPWLILVPQDRTATELHQLREPERTRFLEAVAHTSAALETATGCRSINIAMLGNVVAQLHCHVVARNDGDPNWPAPVWGHGAREPYSEGEEVSFAKQVAESLQSWQAG